MEMGLIPPGSCVGLFPLLFSLVIIDLSVATGVLSMSNTHQLGAAVAFHSNRQQLSVQIASAIKQKENVTSPLLLLKVCWERRCILPHLSSPGNCQSVKCGLAKGLTPSLEGNPSPMGAHGQLSGSHPSLGTLCSTVSPRASAAIPIPKGIFFTLTLRAG